ncbi:MAG: hypothetical protein ACFFDM_00965 [Candidatus Thorarchaeota archaeon]
MTRFKHVLVLVILILPMFALVPTLVTSPNTTLASPVKVDNSLPAQFVEETLRVAVYAEDNLTLPSYASGGVSTAHHANLIQFLDANGYAATPLTTQDILDRELRTANFDVFVLVNNLPRDEIINHVMDFWLGGGGILSFDSGLGFLYFHGIIVPGETGNYGLLNVDISEHWGFDVVSNVTVGARHSTAKDYFIDNVIPIGENTTIHDRYHFAGANSADFVSLFIETGSSDTTVGFALDNSERQGGRIVQLPGNCSVIPAWETSVITDSVDWLAPRPKARILYDLTHSPAYGIDAWDIDLVQYSTTQIDMRGILVNRSYTFDKLYPPSTLSSQSLDGYDILVVCDPNVNFTAAEVSAVTSWVNAGGSILGIADHTLSKNQNMNYLLSNMDIGMNHSAVGTDALVPSDVHVTHEGCSTMSSLAPGAVGTAGSAFSIWEDAAGVPVIGGDHHGNGRIILIADGAIMRDVRIGVADNAQALINFANWLSAATAKILVYADTNSNPAHPNIVPINGPVAKALNGLGESFYLTSDIVYFNLSLFSGAWDMVVFDNNMWDTLNYQPHLIEYVAGGGKLIFNTWDLDTTTGTYFGVNLTNYYSAPPTVYLWETAHPMFNLPVDYGATNINSSLNIFGVEALNFSTYANATPVAGYGPSGSGVAIALGVGGRVIFNGPTWVIYNEDTDNSTYPDNVELWTNQVGFLYYDRPTINHPADVTYMETETGNEITWTPIADAGPWWYVFSVNGTPVENGRWIGGSFTFNVDGVNESITEYELDVFDRLGYSVSDLVMLNVTEYIAPPGPGGFDPMLLLLIGGAVAGIVIILVVVTQLKKKK